MLVSTELKNIRAAARVAKELEDSCLNFYPAYEHKGLVLTALNGHMGIMIHDPFGSCVKECSLKYDTSLFSEFGNIGKNKFSFDERCAVVSTPKHNKEIALPDMVTLSLWEHANTIYGLLKDRQVADVQEACDFNGGLNVDTLSILSDTMCVLNVNNVSMHKLTSKFTQLNYPPILVRTPDQSVMWLAMPSVIEDSDAKCRDTEYVFRNVITNN